MQQGGGIIGWPRLACHGATVCLALPPGVDALPVPAAATILASARSFLMVLGSSMGVCAVCDPSAMPAGLYATLFAQVS